jgi:pimeloyl-ACP methyl ester carboxylesterase
MGEISTTNRQGIFRMVCEQKGRVCVCVCDIHRVRLGFPTFFFHGALGVGDFSSLSSLFFSLHLRVIAPTLPGWGISSPLPDRSLLQWGDDVIAVADHLAIPQDTSFDVMGVSLGAIHALACAVTIPQRVRRVLFISGHAPFTDPAFDPLDGMEAMSSFGLSSFSASFTFLSRLSGWWVRKQTEQDAAAFIEQYLIQPMTSEEHTLFDSLPADRQAELRMRIAENLKASLQHHLTGYVEIPSLLRTLPHSVLSTLRDGGDGVLFASGVSDHVVPHSHHLYYLSHLPRASSLTYPGGHMMSVMQLGKIVRKFVEWEWGGERREEVLDVSTL